METALSQLDVLISIVQHLRDSHGTLATLAWTSRLIGAVALDELWHSVNIIVLARCMPSRYWEEVETYIPFRFSTCGNVPLGEYKSDLTLSAEDRQGDWLGPRFRQYAARIRHLDTKDRVVNRDKYPIRSAHWLPPILALSDRSPRTPWLDPDDSDDVTSYLGPDVLLAWSAYCHGNKLLFPNLRSLSWAPLEIELTNSVDAFLGPALFNLTLDPSIHPYIPSDDEPDNAPAQAAAAIIEHVVSRCTSLGSLDLRSPYVAAPVFGALLGLPIERLKVFRCSRTVPSTLIERLSKSPNLQVLDISFQQTASKLTIKKTSSTFPSLRSLCVKDIDLSDAGSLISAVQSLSLRSLELMRTTKNNSVADFQALLQKLAGSKSASLLQHLRISYELELSSWSPPWLLQSEENVDPIQIRPDLSPLLTLKHLRHVHIDGLRSRIETDLGSMLDAWPNLETLHMEGYSRPPVLLEHFYKMVCDRSSLRALIGIQLECSVGHDLPIVPHGRLPPIVRVGIRVHIAEGDTVERAPLVHYLISIFPDLISKDQNCSMLYGDERVEEIARGARFKRRSDIQWTLDQYREYERSLEQLPTRESDGLVRESGEPYGSGQDWGKTDGPE